MYYILPVEEEERAKWVQTPPKKLTDNKNDYVTFHADGPVHYWYSSQAKKKTPNFPKAACYAACRGKYPDFNLTCYPNEERTRLSLEEALEFFQTLQEVGAVLPEVKLWEEENNRIICHLSKNAGCNQLYYSTLTTYRWLDAHPRLVWEFLRIMNDGTPRHPFQVLPYVVDKYIKNLGHSFIPVYHHNNIGGRYVWGDSRGTALNPLIGVAGKVYFDQQDSRGVAKYRSKPLDSTMVNSAINIIAAEITPMSGNHMKYGLEKPMDALHPSLFELYTIPKITKEQAKAVLAKLFTEKRNY